MKNFHSPLLLSLVAFCSMSAFAAKKHHGASAAAAKKQCLRDNPELKGKDLKACVKTARKASKSHHG